MDSQQIVIRTCERKGLTLIKPKRGNPGIVAYDYKKKDARGVFPCVIDATTWVEAKDQLVRFYAAERAAA